MSQSAPQQPSDDTHMERSPPSPVWTHSSAQSTDLGFGHNSDLGTDSDGGFEDNGRRGWGHGPHTDLNTTVISGSEVKSGWPVASLVGEGDGIAEEEEEEAEGNMLGKAKSVTAPSTLSAEQRRSSGRRTAGSRTPSAKSAPAIPEDDDGQAVEFESASEDDGQGVEFESADSEDEDLRVALPPPPPRTVRHRRHSTSSRRSRKRAPSPTGTQYYGTKSVATTRSRKLSSASRVSKVHRHSHTGEPRMYGFPISRDFFLIIGLCVVLASTMIIATRPALLAAFQGRPNVLVYD